MTPRNLLSHALHLLVEVVVSFIGLLGICACILAWRLAQGPIDVTSLARHEQALLVGPGTQLQIGSAALAWEGFARSDQPLDIRVGDIALTMPDGAKLELAQGRVTLALGQLLLGRLVPRTVAIDGAVIRVVRRLDGTLDIGLGGGAAGASKGGAMPLLRALTAPPRAGDGLPWVSQLHRVVLTDSRAEMHDLASGLVLHAGDASVDLLRQPGGGVTGGLRLELSAGAARSTITADLALDAGGTHVTAHSTPLAPAALAGLDVRLAALAAVETPVAVSLDAHLSPDLAPQDTSLDLALGSGRIALGKGAVSVAQAGLHARLTSQSLAITKARLAFAPAPDAHGPPPVLTAEVTLTRQAGRFHAAFAADVAAMPMADLASYWPPGAGAGSRPWLVENIPGGRARDAHIAGTLQSGPNFDLSDLSLTALSGHMEGDDITLFWLRPVPPIEHGHVRLSVVGPDALHIAIDSGEQQGMPGYGRIPITGGSVEITGLSKKDQIGQIETEFKGQLQDALALLNHPRLHLLSRRPLDITDPSGDVQAHISVHMPLDARVDIDDILIKARADMTGVHLGHLALGRDLDAATLALAADNDGLTLNGHGNFDAIPIKLSFAEDFRDGPPSQLLEHVTADGSPDASQLEKSGLPDGIVTAGSAAVKVDYATRRDHADLISVTADLTGAALATPFDWTKPIGTPASAGADITLRDGRLAGLDHVRADGPGLKLASHVEVDAGQLRALVLDQVTIGRSQAHGRIGLPTKDAGRLTVALQGPRLDLAGYLAEKPAKDPAKDQAPPKQPPEEPPEKPGLPWSADLHFDRVDLAEGNALMPVSLNAQDDGLRISEADVQAGTPRALTARITPTGSGRAVQIDATDAGNLLAAFGTFDNVHGGHLLLTATQPYEPAHSPLSGKVTLKNFQITEAPAIGRLMQAMTLYGLADALRGPGLRFSHLVAPFSWKQGVLTLAGARAFSPSLGLTARGSIDLRRHEADIAGTVVPAYFFNQLLGDLPVVGRVFSPEKGGGVFAARYSVRGKLADPKIGINAFSALTPGFLRGIFDAGR
jgi:hypothetical protein